MGYSLPFASLVSAPAVALFGCAGDIVRPTNAGEATRCQDQERAAHHLMVTCSAPSSVALEVVERAALRRAAERTLSSGFSFFMVVGRHVDREVFVREDGDRSVVFRGGYGAWRRFWRFYCQGQGWPRCGDDPLWPSSVPPRRTVELSYDIELLADSDGGPTALNARKLLELIDPDGAAQLPQPQLPLFDGEPK